MRLSTNDLLSSGGSCFSVWVRVVTAVTSEQKNTCLKPLAVGRFAIKAYAPCSSSCCHSSFEKMHRRTDKRRRKTSPAVSCPRTPILHEEALFGSLRPLLYLIFWTPAKCLFS